MLEYGTEIFGRRAALRYYDELAELVELIVQQRRLGRERPDLLPGIRMHSHGSHVVFYRIDPGEIVIVRVLHASREFKQHLR
jgi:toxin ParE1/3/4